MKHKAVWGLVLSAAVLLSAACGKAGTAGQNDGQWKKGDYLQEYLPVERGGAVSPDIIIADGQAGYRYSGEDADGTAASGVRFCSLSDKTVREIPVPFQPEEQMLKYAPDKTGGLYAVFGLQGGEESREDGGCSYSLAAFDADGRERFRRDITGQVGDGLSVSVRALLVDGQGRLYILGNFDVWLYSSGGEYQGTVELSGRGYDSVQFAGVGREGETYIAGRSQSGYELVEIDFDKKCAGSVYRDFYDGGGVCVFGKGIEKDFLISDENFVYEYDLQERSLVKLFQWMDYDMNGADVQSIGSASEGIVAAAGKDSLSGEYFLVRFSGASGEDISGTEPAGTPDAPPEKQEIVLATLSFKNDSFLQAAVVNFNRTSEMYHITMREYGKPRSEKGERYERWTTKEWSDAVARLNADLVSGNCPDIVDLTDINIEELAQKGVFLDLRPFLDDSAVLNGEDYPENVLEACTYNGRLLGIPKYIFVTSVMAHASEVGIEPGWTLEELIAYAEANPGAELFENASQSDIMNYCMSFYESDFVDWDRGECHFDSPAFKELLEFVRGFPDENEKTADGFVSPPVRIHNRDVLLEKVTLNDFSDLQYQNAVFEDDGIFIGFPTPAGTPGHALRMSSVYAVTSRSQAAEGAWKFIEGYLADPSGGAGGFPSNLQELQKRVDSLANITYMTDSRGNPVLDENGRPIPESGAGGTVSWTDGWSYTYRHETQEELEQVQALLRAARKSDTFNGNGVMMQIIDEEAQAFYKGQKSIDETVEIIQNRARLYLEENK